jgi:hypothetical protein
MNCKGFQRSTKVHHEWEVQTLLKGRLWSEEEAWNTVCLCLTATALAEVVKAICSNGAGSPPMIRIVLRAIT